MVYLIMRPKKEEKIEEKKKEKKTPGLEETGGGTPREGFGP